MRTITTLDYSAWRPEVGPEQARAATHALESGEIVMLPNLPFRLEADERHLLSPRWTDGKAKNVSFDPRSREVRHTSATGADREAVGRMIGRFSDLAGGLVDRLFPLYKRGIRFGLTSYRPIEVAGRESSRKKDDTLLHVDAFVSRPNGGERILRLFSNVNPDGRAREWTVGDPFEKVAARFLPVASRPLPGSAHVLKAIGYTKGLRTEYDHYMLQLHDRAKLDAEYQETCDKTHVSIPAGATWAVFTDSVPHAVTAGQYVLEQTFYLAVDAMQDPALSPLRTLERMLGRALV